MSWHTHNLHLVIHLVKQISRLSFIKFSDRSRRQAALYSQTIRELVNKSYEKLCARSEDFRDRLVGIITWEDVENMHSYKSVYQSLTQLASSPNEVELQVRILVGKLFKQRIAGTNITNVFDCDQKLVVNSKPKLQKRYQCLQTACLMELSSILAGLEYMGECYPDMFYANTNPTGMNNIAVCLNNIRRIVRQHGQECPEVSVYAQRNNQLIMAAYEQK